MPTARARTRSSWVACSARTATGSSSRPSSDTCWPRRQEHSEGERPQRWDGPFVRQALEASLRRLGTDHSTSTSSTTRAATRSTRDECFATLDQLSAEGKIAPIRRCSRTRDRLAGGGAASDLRPRDRVGADRLQPARAGPGPRVHGHGRRSRRRRHGPGPDLVGPVGRQPDAGDHLRPRDHRRHRPREWLVEGLHKVERVRFLCDPETGRTMAQAALRFILAQPQMTVVIPTITNEAELREYAGAADVPDLTAEELARVASSTSATSTSSRSPSGLELRGARVDLVRGLGVLNAFQIVGGGTAAPAQAAAAARGPPACRERRSRAGPAGSERLAFDGALIVWGVFRSLRVTEKSTLTLLTPESPTPSGGTIDSDSESSRRMRSSLPEYTSKLASWMALFTCSS